VLASIEEIQMTVSQRKYREAANGKRSGVNTRRPRRTRTAPPERHARKCLICRHPHREEIDDAFLHWRSPARIASDYNLAHRRNLYRHARATGLFALRLTKLRCAVEMIIEHANAVTPSADAVIRAIHACCLINDRGEWHEPPRRVIYIHKSHDATARGSAPDQTASEEDPASDDSAPQSATHATAADPTGVSVSPPSIEIEPGLYVSATRQGVRLDSNRQFLARLETAGNA
jgi:hypothetical protein